MMNTIKPDAVLPAGKWDVAEGRRGRIGDKIFFNLTLIFTLLMVLILVGLIIILNIDAWPAIQRVSEPVRK